MQVKTLQILAILILIVFCTGAWIPAYTSGVPANWPTSQPTNQSITGKIVAIGDAEFSVEIGKTKNADPVRFLIDENTKVEGRLSVGARARVEYHTEGTSNIAVHVVVMPSTGYTPR
jgi:hypothetical protein